MLQSRCQSLEEENGQLRGLLDRSQMVNSSSFGLDDLIGHMKAECSTTEDIAQCLLSAWHRAPPDNIDGIESTSEAKLELSPSVEPQTSPQTSLLEKFGPKQDIINAIRKTDSSQSSNDEKDKSFGVKEDF